MEVTEHISVRRRAAELGCVAPEKIAILPINFDNAPSREEFVLRSEAATLKTLFRIGHVPTDDLLYGIARPAYVQHNAFDWIAPTLFISASIWSQNEMAVSVALNVLSNYISDYFKGFKRYTVKLEFIVERKVDYECRKLTYEGEASGLSNLAEIIKGISNGER